MKITKKIFKDLIVGKLLNDIPLSEMFDEKHNQKIKEAQRTALEIIEFAEQYELFRKDLE